MSRSSRDEFNTRGIANVMWWMGWVSIPPCIIAAALTALLDINVFLIALLGFLIGCWLLNGYRIERGRGYPTPRMQRWFWAVSVAYNSLPPIVVATLYVLDSTDPLGAMRTDFSVVISGLNSDSLFSILFSFVTLYATFWLPAATMLSAIALAQALARQPAEEIKEVAS